MTPAKVHRASGAAFGLAGQIAVVTGAASGIGRGCALALGFSGCVVVINHLPGDEAAADGLAHEIEAAGGGAFPFAADVSREDEVEAMFAAARSRFGTVQILVNNAGIQSGARVQDMTLAQWRKVMAVNLDGQFLCARAAVREFLRRGPQPEVSSAMGKSICMSSVHQVIPWAFEANYAASKGGVMLLMQSLAQEFAERIRVIATIEAIQRDLVEGGLVLRYRPEDTPDGLTGGEGTFLVCSFWLVDALTMMGRLDEAEALFEHLLSLRNDLGLLAEEYDPGARRQLGNFPQAFSHVGLVNAANNLISARGPAEQRADRTAPVEQTSDGVDRRQARWNRAPGSAPEADAAIRRHPVRVPIGVIPHTRIARPEFIPSRRRSLSPDTFRL